MNLTTMIVTLRAILKVHGGNAAREWLRLHTAPTVYEYRQHRLTPSQADYVWEEATR